MRKIKELMLLLAIIFVFSNGVGCTSKQENKKASSFTHDEKAFENMRNHLRGRPIRPYGHRRLRHAGGRDTLLLFHADPPSKHTRRGPWRPARVPHAAQRGRRLAHGGLDRASVPGERVPRRSACRAPSRVRKVGAV